MKSNALSEADVKVIASSFLDERLRPYGYKHVTVEDEEDFDGSHILRMIARVGQHVPARQLIDTLAVIRTALLEKGEQRLVYLSTVSQDSADIGEDDDEAV